MDRETKHALASIYEHLKLLYEQLADVQATALGLKLSLEQSDPKFRQRLAQIAGGQQVSEIALQLEHTRVSLDAVIHRLLE
jgi:hypothetical protein